MFLAVSVAQLLVCGYIFTQVYPILYDNLKRWAFFFGFVPKVGELESENSKTLVVKIVHSLYSWDKSIEADSILAQGLQVMPTALLLLEEAADRAVLTSSSPVFYLMFV